MGGSFKIYQSIVSTSCRVQLNLVKSEFRKARYLGHVIGQGQIPANDDKVEAMKLVPPPTNKKYIAMRNIILQIYILYWKYLIKCEHSHRLEMQANVSSTRSTMR